MNDHLNQTQLAKRWDMKTGTLERWRIEGLGPVFLKIGGRVMYRLEDIQAYEQHCMRASTSQSFTGDKP